MHAVVVRVTVSDREAADHYVREEIASAVPQAPGFVAGYWTRKVDSGLGMAVFESEDAAETMSRWVPSMAADFVTVEDVEVREVLAHA
jgi:hypothetical protein